MANTYDSYKDSGIAWIGDIPSGWEIKRLGNFYNPRNEKVSDKDFPPLSVTMKGIVPQLETAAKTDDGDNRKLVKKGDFAINSRSDRRGSCGISDYDGSVSLINTVLCPKGQMNAGFYNWLFHTSMFADEYYKWGHGIVDDLWTTKWSDMKNICVVVPSLEEQSSIATFLDQKCAEIDSLISLQEEMISELQAFKQSVITEAVTKGLDKNVKMKDSGVEWIGEIPEHWKLPQLRFVTSKIGSGSTPTGGANVYVNEGVKFLRSQNVYNEGFKLDDVAYITPETHNQMSGTKVLEGDILFNITGGSIGRCCLVDANWGEANVNQHVSIVRPSSIYGKYLMYYLQSEAGQMQVNILQTGGNREGLSASAFSEFHICVPSPNEQHSIATYLDKKTSLIDSIIALKQQKITELKDYKKSIIYECVTGKKEVV